MKAAIEAAKAQGPFDEELNANGNGNALVRICQGYLELTRPELTAPAAGGGGGGA